VPAAAIASAVAPGWYGKLPAIGDFAARRLPAEFVARWDEWLQAGLAASRAQLGERWLDLYMNAPIRRFVLGPALLGPATWAGVLLPSVDRVGRHFPLTIATPLAGGAAAAALDAWFATIEPLALGALDLDASLDAFDATVAAASLDMAVAAASPHAEASDATTDAGRSRWWSADDPVWSRNYTGLPPPAAFAALLGAGIE
jgi:type VI secretion system protein ImpM